MKGSRRLDVIQRCDRYFNTMDQLKQKYLNSAREALCGLEVVMRSGLLLITLGALMTLSLGCGSRSAPEGKVDHAMGVRSIQIQCADSLRTLLGRTLSDARRAVYSGGIEVRDSLYEGDEGVQWPGLYATSYSGELLFELETNWQDTVTIQRLSILSPAILTKDSLHVGMYFRDVKPYLSRSIPSMPDGYLGLNHRSDSRITFFFNVDPNSRLALGVDNLDDIPDTLRIREILIDAK